MDKDGLRFQFEVIQHKRPMGSSSNKKLRTAVDIELTNAFDLSNQPISKTLCQITIPVNPELELGERFDTNVLKSAGNLADLWDRHSSPNPFLKPDPRARSTSNDLESFNLLINASMTADRLLKSETLFSHPNHRPIDSRITTDFAMASFVDTTIQFAY